MCIWKAQEVRQDSLSIRVSSRSELTDTSYCRVFSLTIYSYVQMLERQHAQLIAGLQELYHRTQNGDGWTGPPLVLGNQPLTHKLLEALGVLELDQWEDTEDVGNTWQVFEKQGHDDNGWTYSNTGSPSTQAAFSPTSPTQSAFPQSTIMSKRQSKLQTSLAPTALTLSMPPPLMVNLAPVKPEPYNYPFPNQMPILSDNYRPNEAGLDRAPGPMDWSFGMDDLFGNLGGQEQSVKGC